MCPRDTNQRFLNIGIMRAGATIFGYMVGNMSTILDGRNLSSKKYHQEMDELLEFCEDLMASTLPCPALSLSPRPLCRRTLSQHPLSVPAPLSAPPAPNRAVRAAPR